MKIVIDRIEGKIAICQNLENKEMIEINIEKLPKEIKEGNVLIFENGKYEIDIIEEEKRRKRIEEKMKNLWI